MLSGRFLCVCRFPKKLSCASGVLMLSGKRTLCGLALSSLMSATSLLDSEATHLFNTTGPSTSSTTRQPDPVTDTDYCDTPRKAGLKRKLCESQNALLSSRKKIKLLQQSKYRLIKRNATLSNIIVDLRKNDLMGSDSLDVLQKSAGGVADLLK